MRRFTILLITALFAGGCSGCSNTVWVREKVVKQGEPDSYSQIGGIPFYVKKEVFTQKTSYARTWLVATLGVEKTLITKGDDDFKAFPLDKQIFEKRLTKERLPELDTIKERILRGGVLANSDVDLIVSMFSVMKSEADITSIGPELIGNTVQAGWVVDEKQKYYLNAPLPWFGTGNLSQELTSDGTLSKVASAPDTKLAEGLSSLIPLKEYLNGKFVDPLKDDSAAQAAAKILSDAPLPMAVKSKIGTIKGESELVHKVTLNITEVGYIYRFTKEYEDAPASSPLPFDPDKLTFTRETIGEKPNQAPKEDGKSIGLTGTISLPKDWPK